MSVKCITKNWASCKCFYIKNIYLKQLDEHLQFREGQDKEFRDYCQEYHPSANSEELLLEIKTEIERRKTRFSLIEKNRRRILDNYKPLHGELYSKPLKLQLTGEPRRLTENVYYLPVLDSETCDKITSELSHFYSQGLAHSQPTSMRKTGAVLHELGMNNIVDSMLPSLEDLARKLFPLSVAEEGFDSYKAFTVEYDADDAKYPKDLGTHFDNSEVTLNISLTDDHEDGELYFIRNEKLFPVSHRKGVGIFHPGSELHGAMPLTGSRTNLIIWLRCSSLRNEICPMCGEEPSLEEVAVGDSTGDGFTLP